MEDSEDKGYTVKDRRFLHMSEEEKAKLQEEATAAQGETPPEAAEAAGAGPEVPLPEISFPSFLVSLSSSAFISLGQIPDPHTGKQEKNLPLAKQTIDLLGVLREKTRNNLTTEEDNLFDHLLYDLRMAYIKEVG
jgi:Domain of unknown function (DUF1844)